MGGRAKIRFGLGERIDHNDPRLELPCIYSRQLLGSLGLGRAPQNPDVM